MKHLSLLFLVCLCACRLYADEAKPWTFWYWMNGAVSREGITKDLEAMAEIGLGGCYLMPIYGIDQAPELGGTIRQGTREWWEMVDFSLREADRLGLKIGMHICDGFALAGGPWTTPGQSMRIVTYTDTILHIGDQGLEFNPALLPAKTNDDFRDIAYYAVPLQYQPENTTLHPHISSDNPDFSIDKKGRIKCTSACTFTYTYDQPVTVSALQITTYNNSLQALRMKVNGHQLTPPRHGWQNYDQPTTVSIPTATTQQLTFEWTPEGTEKGSEDLDNGKWGKTLKIQDMKVLATPRINDWEGKSGRVWRVSSVTQDVTTPEMYVPLEQLICLTPDTHLPQGDWRILRIGHCSTLHENATGGDCRGLECDKFSQSAIQNQLNHWFGEAFRQCDSTMVHRVLKYMHIDSWECASQNWSDSIILTRDEERGMSNGCITFAEYFAQQRGYDLLPYLPLMVGIPIQDCETSERVLRDVRNTIAQAIDEKFFPTLAAKARELNCQISAESVAPTMVSDGMAHYRHVDLPMGEFWLNSKTHDKPNDMLDAISGAHIYGKRIVQAEGFTQLKGIFNETPAQLKPLLDKQFCLGMNRLFFHVYTHNPNPEKKPGMTLNGIGVFFQRTQPWWPEARSFVNYITRCQRLLQWGQPVVDLAVYTGHEIPRRAILPERLPAWNGYHYDSFNYDALVKLIPTNSHDSLNDCMPDYKALILPGARKMDPDCQPLPENALQAIEGLQSSNIRVIKGTPTAEQLKAFDILPDALLPTGVEFAHRQGKEGDIYFLSNQKDEPVRFEGYFRADSKDATLYDAVSNTFNSMEILADKKEKPGYTGGLIELPANGSCFVLFGQLSTPETSYNTAPTHNTIVTSLNRTTPYQLDFEEHGITITSDTLLDWSTSENDSIRYYSGRVRYSFDFKFKHSPKKLKRILLKLNHLHDVATISLNGKECGSVWTSPYEVDITKAIRKGKNHMEIWVANSWNNAILGHDTGHDPFKNIWTNAKYRNPNPTLLPAGIGSLELRLQ